MRKLLALILSATLATSALAITGEQVIEVVAGFTSAIVQKDDLNEMKTCAKDADILAADVEGVIHDVTSFTFSGFFDAIERVGRIMGESPFVFRDCENLQDDLNVIKEQAAIFTNIGELTERITKNYVWHYSEIMDDIHTANADAATGDYYGFGQNIGDAVFVALQP
jgi:hypothetical protein